MSDLMLNSFFNDPTFEDFFGFRAKPLSVRFTTPYTKDVTPVAPWQKDEDGNYYTTVRMVGIDEDDVNISLEDYGLHIHGESKTFGQEYSQDLKLGIAKETLSNIDAVNYEVKNGMCKIELIMKEITKKTVKINKVTTTKQIELNEGEATVE